MQGKEFNEDKSLTKCGLLGDIRNDFGANGKRDQPCSLRKFLFLLRRGGTIIFEICSNQG